MLMLNRAPAEWLAYIKERGADRSGLLIREHLERFDPFDVAGSLYLQDPERFKAAGLDTTHFSTMLMDMRGIHTPRFMSITLADGITYFNLRPSHAKTTGVKVSMLRLVAELMMEEEADGPEHCMVVRANAHALIGVMGHLYPMIAWLLEQNFAGALFENELVSLLYEYGDEGNTEEREDTA